MHSFLLIRALQTGHRLLCACVEPRTGPTDPERHQSKRHSCTNSCRVAEWRVGILASFPHTGRQFHALLSILCATFSLNITSPGLGRAGTERHRGKIDASVIFTSREIPQTKMFNTCIISFTLLAHGLPRGIWNPKGAGGARKWSSITVLGESTSWDLIIHVVAYAVA